MAKLSTRQRLLKKVRYEDRGYESPCLIWLGETDKDGYGRIKHKVSTSLPTGYLTVGQKGGMIKTTCATSVIVSCLPI